MNECVDVWLVLLFCRWRTALILRELEEEVAALTAGRPHSEALKELMGKKEVIGDLFNNLRLARQRALSGRKGEGREEWMGRATWVVSGLHPSVCSGREVAGDGFHTENKAGRTATPSKS